MAVQILDSAAAAAAAAATDQTAQRLPVLTLLGAGNVTMRYYTGATLVATVTHGPVVPDALTPLGFAFGPRIAFSVNVSGQTVTHAILRNAGGVDVLRYEASDLTPSLLTTQTGQALNAADAVATKLRTTARAALPTTPPAPPPGTTLITLAGQSNANGRALIGEISAAPLASDAGLAAYAGSAFDRVKIWDGSAFSALRLGVNNNGVNPPSATEFGPEFGLAVRWMRETTSETLYIVKNGASGVSITAFEPDAGFNQYQILASAHTAAASALTTAGVSIARRALVWIQGESDTGQTQSFYQTRMQAILNASYTRGWFTATDKQLLVQMAATSTLYDANVAAAKTAIAAAAPSYIHAPNAPGYFDASGYHQNGRGQVQMGYDAFELIFNAAHINV